MKTTIIINESNYVTVKLHKEYCILSAFIQKLLIKWRHVQSFMINLLAHY